MITNIISGGQTGADRGGLDAAIHCGLPHGGWCPRGRNGYCQPKPNYASSTRGAGNLITEKSMDYSPVNGRFCL
jgi:hypothetical protein